ncbi:hypothetical protein DFQ26_001782 [Actinomortierella ambigua]|nr:hypothetical protein DFQ26_001782 [Actinomortierella ambigua]
MYYYPPDLSKEHSLSYNYEKYIPRDPMIDERIDALLDALVDIKTKEKVKREQQQQHSQHASSASQAPPPVSITTADFISYRGVLTKLLCTPYTRNEPWEIRATLFKGSIYLNEYVPPEKRAKNLGETDRHKLMSYWGYRFETLCTLSKPSSELQQQQHHAPQRVAKRRISASEDPTPDEQEQGQEEQEEKEKLQGQGHGQGQSDYPSGSDGAEKKKKEDDEEEEEEESVRQGWKKLKLDSAAPSPSSSSVNSEDRLDTGHHAALLTADDDDNGRKAKLKEAEAMMEMQDPELVDRLEGVVNTNVQYCTVARTRLGEHSIILGAEVDCTLQRKRPAPANPLDDYVELKTSRVIGSEREQTSYEKFKLLKFWAQSYLAGVPTIVVGFRDDNGIVRELQTLKTAEIPQIVRGRRGFWDKRVCINFLDGILKFIRTHVVEDDPMVSYALRWDQPFQGVTIERLARGESFLTDRFLDQWTRLSSRD